MHTLSEEKKCTGIYEIEYIRLNLYLRLILPEF